MNGTPTGSGRSSRYPGNHLHPYAPDFSRRIELYGSGEGIVGPVDQLPEPERGVLAAEGVLSVASAPIFMGEEWWGYVGFDDCTDDRAWSEEDIESLRVGRRGGRRGAPT